MKLGQVRPATQANRFYTGDAEELENEVDSLLKQHNSQVYDNLAALIVPHAGYYFSLATISLEMWQRRPI